MPDQSTMILLIKFDYDIAVHWLIFKILSKEIDEIYFSLFNESIINMQHLRIKTLNYEIFHLYDL